VVQQDKKTLICSSRHFFWGDIYVKSYRITKMTIFTVNDKYLCRSRTYFFRECKTELPMWWKRKEPPDHDAELRSLMKQYNAQVKSSSSSPSPTIAKPQSSPVKQASASTPEELIQGQYISYTPTEANLYADEELCDTFRHIDVLSLSWSLLIVGMVPSPFALTHGFRLLSIWIPTITGSLLE